MTFTQLEIFICVAEYGGFTLAAQQLGISQSAVSHALKGLEVELGIRLIERKKHQAMLTHAGFKLLPKAREIVGLSHAIQQEASDLKGLKQGSVRIGSFGPTSSLQILPGVLNHYCQTYPGIEVNVDEGNDQQIVQWLLERRIDVGFLVLPDERFETYPLFDDELVALVPSGHRLAIKDSVSIQDLTHDSFILTEAGSGTLVKALFQTHQCAPKVRFRTSQVLSTLKMVSQGLGVSILAQSALPKEPVAKYQAVRIQQTQKRKVGIGYLSKASISPAALAFVQATCDFIPD